MLVELPKPHICHYMSPLEVMAKKPIFIVLAATMLLIILSSCTNLDGYESAKQESADTFLAPWSNSESFQEIIYVKSFDPDDFSAFMLNISHEVKFKKVDAKKTSEIYLPCNDLITDKIYADYPPSKFVSLSDDIYTMEYTFDLDSDAERVDPVTLFGIGRLCEYKDEPFLCGIAHDYDYCAYVFLSMQDSHLESVLLFAQGSDGGYDSTLLVGNLKIAPEDIMPAIDQYQKYYIKKYYGY